MLFLEEINNVYFAFLIKAGYAADSISKSTLIHKHLWPDRPIDPVVDVRRAALEMDDFLHICTVLFWEISGVTSQTGINSAHILIQEVACWHNVGIAHSLHNHDLV